ncbi:NAD-dependent epimerase/dehydratase family protein [Dechloromonas sp. HYN0024]|nr:SDR family oxidoreductase [Dechloromonas sp. HYN0024]AXS81506.1 NAD-dependent epimerase/dehydratase family protein [Dechloromonas sp. HYN0024]
MSNGGILVTGATGFVGNAVCAALVAKHSVRGVARQLDASPPLLEHVELVSGELSADFDWSGALVGIRMVVHCAARVHVMNEVSSDPLAEFRRVNVAGTVQLARQAAAAGVKRFIFLSSIKVNGEQTQIGSPFSADQMPNPADSYGVSKMEAEEGLRTLARETGMEVVIIRPPLVYGPGVKANFLAMMRVLYRGFPLPLGSVTQNKRSLVALDNLVDFVVTCLAHPAAANQTFLVSDAESLSTSALLNRMAKALGRPARLFPVPVSWLKLGARLIGKRDMAQRLCDSLEIDIRKNQELLGWAPRVDVDEGLRRVVDCMNTHG